MKINLNFKWLIPLIIQFWFVQTQAQINKAEYFYDADPGIGNGITLNLTGNGDTASYLGGLSTVGLGYGYHTIYIRALKTNGQWGLLGSSKFYVLNNSASITKAEYFFDTDPGINNGINLALTALNDTSNFLGGINTTGLSGGKHLLYVRAQTSDGKWSITAVKNFTILNTNASIIAAEYFFDTDPGVGNGATLAITSAADTATFNGNINSAGLSKGSHNLYIRTKNNSGAWGNVERRKFNVSAANAAPIIAEYFVDTDPGIGNGTSVALTSIGSNMATYTGLFNPSLMVGSGTHKLYVRALSDDGKWGLTDSASFYINCGAWYRDYDGDGFGNANVSVINCVQPLGYVATNTDCNDSSALEKPGQIWYKDIDGDNYGAGVPITACIRPPNAYLAMELIATSGDCNDAVAAINPAATETCDGLDNDCDGLTDENVSTQYFADADGDGYGNSSINIYACTQPVGYVLSNTDCNDNAANVHTPQPYFIDADNDGFGSTPINLCSGTAPFGYSSFGGDCNDANATIYPTAPEICDGLDNNCNGLIDMLDPTITNLLTWYIDVDGDTYGNPNDSVKNCTAPMGYVANKLDCNDANAIEQPNQTWYIDNDDDLFGTGATTIACLRPSHGYLFSELKSSVGDCDDNNPSIRPNAQYFNYSSGAPFVTSVASPLQGSSYNTFSFEVVYIDSSNNLPPATYPRVILDFEGNGNYTGSNDRTIIMTAADVNDNNTIDGKKYIGTINALPTGINYQTIIQTSNGVCNTNFGPFNYPDVVVYPDLQIFANDITFSNTHPSTSSPLTINALIKNVSDYNAQNFVVHLTNQFDTTIVYPDIVVGNLSPQSSTTVSWNITTPNVPAWCPMQVAVDYTNAISETNELDNKAIRPFVNGNYTLPGKILLQADVSPKVSTTINYPTCTLFGNAHYTGTAVPLQDSSVAGATVEFTIAETGATFSGYTNSNGAYAIGFPKPALPGTYHINAHVTDFTLDGYDTTDFTVVFVVNPCFSDLQSSIAITANTILVNGYGNTTILAGESINGIITITNTGCGSTIATTYASISQSGGSFTIPNFNVPALASGASFTTSFTNLIFTTAGTYNICANADANNIISESNEGNNGYCRSINVLPNLPDISIQYATSGSGFICNNPNGINVGISNTGGGATGAFNVKTIVLFNNNPVDSFLSPITNIIGLSNTSINLPYLFNQVGVYTLKIFADAPLFNGNVSELNENNNSGIYNFTTLDCKPDLQMTSCKSINANAANPLYTGTLTLSAIFTNNGNLATTTPFVVRFSLSGGTIINTTYTNNVLPGQTVTVTATTLAPIPATQILTATLDATNIITEFSESNNDVSDNMCWDFYPTSMCNGNNFWNQGYIKNQAINLYVAVGANYMYDAQNLPVNFKVSGPGLFGNINLGNATLSNISKTCYCPFVAYLPNNFVFPDSGLYTFTITTDPNNTYTECNESNNTIVVSVYVTSQADMRVLSQYINPSLLNPNVGQAITFDISYDNVGAQNVNDSMELFLQIDNTPFDSIKPVGGLVTNDNATIHFSTAYSSLLPGVHVARAIIDHDNEIVETNEVNNEATRAFFVGSLPNLFTQIITATNLVPANNENIQIQGQVNNDGDSYCDADMQLSYIDNNQDTIIIGTQHISVPANGNTFFSIPWTVVDNKTTIIAKIINTSTLEATYVDNNTTLQIGAMIATLNLIPSCNGAPNGKAIALGVGGEAPYTYLWNTGVAKDTLTASIGTYTITVTDNTGQSVTKIATITNTLPPNIIPNATPSTIINGNTVVLSASGAFSYGWAGANLSAAMGAVTSASPTITSTYTVTGASVFGCTSTSTINVIVMPQLSIAAQVSSSPCTGANNGSITATSIGGTAPKVFTINPNVGTQTSSGIFSGLSAGTYTIAVMDGLAVTATTTVVISPIASALVTTISASPILCNGNTSNVSLTTTGGLAPYSITGNALSNLLANNYTYTVTDANGCSKTTQINITEPSNIVINKIISPPSICNLSGGSFTLSATGGIGLLSVTISPMVNNLSVGVYANASGGTYTAIATDAQGCTKSTTILLNTPTPILVQEIIAAPSCNGLSNGLLTVNATGGNAPYTYSISPIKTQVVNGTFININSGIYIIKATDASGCSKTIIIPVAQPSIISFPTIVKTNITCNGGNNGSLSVTTIGGVGLKTLSILPTATAVLGGFNNLASGAYVVTARDANFCTRTTSVTIIQPTAIIWGALLSVNPIAPNSGSINVSASGGAGTKIYSINPSATQSPVAKFIGLNSGTYTIQAADANGCTISTVTTLVQASFNVNNGEVFQEENISETKNLIHSGLTIYPNPTKGLANLIIPSNKNKAVTIIITDISGRQVRHIETALLAGSNTIKLDIADVLNGIYTITVMDNSNKGSIIINKD